MTLLKIGLLLSLLGITWEDFCYRAVHVGWFIAFGLFGGVLTVWQYGWLNIWQNILLNIGFVGLQLILTTIYFSFKKGKSINIADQYLGWGDIVFLVLSAVLLNPIWFVIYYTFSLIIVLVAFMIYRLLSNNPSNTIPLAGGMAICTMILLTFGWFSSINWHEMPQLI